jgi:hypothetical protein
MAAGRLPVSVRFPEVYVIIHRYSSSALDFNNFSNRGVAAIANMLQNNSILMDLHLFGNHIDAEGGRLLAQSLKKNIRLATLILSFNNLGGTGLRLSPRRWL